MFRLHRDSVLSRVLDQGHAILSLVIGTGAVVLMVCDRISAQALPDTTQGPESSVVFPFAQGEIIFGGAERGANLFHSFSSFSVPEGQATSFLPSASIQNIFARVTGSSISRVDGLLLVNGPANLFLLNPNGVVMGPNASVVMDGSFIATLANRIAFEDGFQFGSGTPPTPLLTVSVPVGLQFDGNNGAIVNQAGNPGILFGPGQTFGLIGGDVSLTSSRLLGSNTRFVFGGLQEAGEITLTPDALGWKFDFPDRQGANVTFTDALSFTSGEFVVQGDRIELGGSNLITTANGTQAGAPITLMAQTIDLSRGSNIATQAGASPGGDIAIATQQLTLTDASSIGTATSDAGKGGNLTVQTNGLQVEQGSVLASSSDAIGTGGNVTITADDVMLGGSLLSVSEGLGAAGNLTLDAKTVQLAEPSLITSATLGSGNAGRLTIKADTLQADGQIGSFTFTGGGNAGRLELDISGPLNVNGDISSSSLGAGNAGTLIVRAKTLQLAADGLISSSTLGSGDAGDLTITAETLRTNGPISSFTDASGNAGNLRVDVANTVEVIGPQASLLSSTGGRGEAGNLTITTGLLRVQEDGAVGVGSLGGIQGGPAGDLAVNAQRIELNNGVLSANSSGRDGGNIRIQASDFIFLRNNSLINASGGTENLPGQGGNVDIQTPFLLAIASENSDISANAFSGSGGNIQIAAQGIFGIQSRARLSPFSDITASSDLGLQGTISFTNLEVDPSDSIIDLPTVPVDPSTLIAQNCAVEDNSPFSQFVVTGQGGLPPSPRRLLQSSVVWEDVRSQPPTASVPTSSPHLVPAQGWIRNAQGQIVLVAHQPGASPKLAYADCRPGRNT